MEKSREKIGKQEIKERERVKQERKAGLMLFSGRKLIQPVRVSRRFCVT